jgi:multiple sugar transport system permease protein
MQMSMRQSQRLKLGLTYVLLALWAIFCLFPIYWLIITSVKLPIAVFQGPKYVPWIDFQPSLHAWEDVLFGRFQDEVVRRWTNSAIMAISSAALAVAIGSMAGYALTRFQYFVPGLKWRNNDLAFWIISQRMLPPVVIILPYIIMFRFLRLIDTHAGMILVYTVFNLPFVVWIMRDFFAGLPLDLEESALIDGASRLQAFTKIVLPLSTPGLIATFLFCLMFAWNDYIFALMLTFSRASTMPMYVAGAGSQSYGPQWWYLSALALLTIAPMILIALLVERYITRGLVVGAIK